MRGDIVHRVYAVHQGRDKDCFFGAFRSVAEARQAIQELEARKMNGGNWAAQYHNQGFVIREVVVDTDFELPTRPKPRDKYVVKTAPKHNSPGTSDSTRAEVFRRNSSGDLEKICEYERNYSMLGTFEPFRQKSRELALISRDYTKTAVLDLVSGKVIAEEEDQFDDEGRACPGAGFCPVGFYAPDWWDVNDGSIIPGSEYWDQDDEWPTGDFGFVWGCYWGDDCSWKVQLLDLRRVQEGIIGREERFGYVELATEGYEAPCLDPGPLRQAAPPHFIRVSKYSGSAKVTFAVEMGFDLASGKSRKWKRERSADMD